MLKCFLYGLEKESTSLLTVMTELWWYYVGLQVRVREVLSACDLSSVQLSCDVIALVSALDCE